MKLYLLICSNPKGKAVRHKKVYTSLSAAKMAVRAVPTNKAGDPWKIFEVTNLKEIPSEKITQEAERGE